MFGVAVWGGHLTVQDKNKMKRVKTCGERILGTPGPAWEVAYAARVKQITENILGDKNHPLHKEFRLFPYGLRLRQKRVRTKRFGASFIPCSISMYNMTVIRFIMYALPSICTNHFYTIISPFYVYMLHHWQSNSLTAIKVIYVILYYKYMLPTVQDEIYENRILTKSM